MGRKKKEKVRYIDDGRTLADMSGVGGGRLPDRNPLQPRASLKEQWQTYKAAVKMMLTPMLVVIVGICIVYMILHAIFWLM